MMKARGVNYIGFIWVPMEREPEIKEVIASFGSAEFKPLRRDASDDHLVDPPTYFKTNSVTYIFQEITNTYGVPKYHEANPSVFGIVTFPFQFAVMFGDYGHGSLIFLVGAFLVLFNDKLKGGALDSALQLRYILMMMGAMAVFTGLLYNEFFAIPNNWFGTCFDVNSRCTTGDVGCNPSYFPKGCEDPALGCEITCVYPFGVDPAWYLSPNLLTFTNNIKMKLAVIIGVVHMTIGVLVKGTNAIFFRNHLDLIFEVITGLVILLGMFGWMDLLIFSKWTYAMNPYSVDPAMQETIKSAPSIITVMINNFLAGGYPGTNAYGVQ